MRRAFIQRTLESFRGLDERELRRRMLDPELVKMRLAELDNARAARRASTGDV